MSATRRIELELELDNGADPWPADEYVRGAVTLTLEGLSLEGRATIVIDEARVRFLEPLPDGAPRA